MRGRVYSDRPYNRRVVGTYEWCPLTRGVRLREVSAYERCPLMRGVRL